MFRKIHHTRTADAAIQQIEELILSGVLRPGDRLPAERDLSGELAVSRPVLREALKTLEHRGLLFSRQGGGTVIADVIGPIFSEAVVALIGRHPSATSDYLEFRKDIEAVAAGHAAERASPTDHRILSEIIDQMDGAHTAGNHQREAELDVDLHQAIGEAAHNVILLHSLRSCYRLLANGVFFNRQRLDQHPTALAVVLAQHKEIVAHIIAGNTEAASEASRRHIAFVAQALDEAADAQARKTLADQRRQQRQNSASPPRSRPRSVKVSSS